MTIIGLDTSVLSSWYGAQQAQSAARLAPQPSGVSSRSSAAADVAPPWETETTREPSDVVRAVLASDSLIDESLSSFSDLDASDDDKKLFALYEGLEKLNALAVEAQNEDLLDFQRTQIQARFQDGLAEINEFIAATEFDGVSIVSSAPREFAQGDTAIPSTSSDFTTGVVHQGAFDEEVAAFVGVGDFTITVTNASGAATDVAVDLDAMGATPRTLDNVATFINGALAAEGFITEFKRVKIGEPDDDGVVQGDQFGFEIRGSASERLSFSVPPGEASPAVRVAGVSGGVELDEDNVVEPAGQVFRITDLDAAQPTVGKGQRIESAEDEDGATGEVRTIAAEVAPDGALYTLSQVVGDPAEGPQLRGENDVLLTRYDSTGREVWSRVVGADGAEGAALAVDPVTGGVVVAGRVTGDLGDTIDRGQGDGFVAAFDAEGRETWLQRYGTTTDDTVADVVVDAAGVVYVAGSVQAGLDGSTHGGGRDAYVRAIAPGGQTQWTTQIGGTGEESAAALAVAADGSVLVATEEDGAGELRKLAAGDGAVDPAWSYSLGDLDFGRVTGLAVDDAGDVYVAGAARSGFAAPNTVNAHAGGGARDAFVTKLTGTDAPTAVYTTFLGTGAEDVANDLQVSDGAVYLAGYTDGDLGGADALVGDRDAFAAKLDAESGGVDWVQHLSGRAGQATANAIAVDPEGASALDAFGLPRGALESDQSVDVVDRTAARAGDHFYVRVDGGAKRKITLEEGQSLQSLTFDINNKLVLDGEASTWRADGGRVLRIEPEPGVRIELLPGSEGQDLLSSLGLQAGVVEKPAEVREGEVPARRQYGLALSDDVNLQDEEAVTAAVRELDGALATIRRAHRELGSPPELEDDRPGKTGGQVPEYLTNRIAEYENALLRLGG